MNIEEISTFQVQAEDVPEDIPITNLPLMTFVKRQ
jgi:hypothetical protein